MIANFPDHPFSAVTLCLGFYFYRHDACASSQSAALSFDILNAADGISVLFSCTSVVEHTCMNHVRWNGNDGSCAPRPCASPPRHDSPNGSEAFAAESLSGAHADTPPELECVFHKGQHRDQTHAFPDGSNAPASPGAGGVCGGAGRVNCTHKAPKLRWAFKGPGLIHLTA